MSYDEQSPGKTLYRVIAALLVVGALVGLIVLPRLNPAGAKLLDKPAPNFSLPIVANGEPNARMRLSDLRDKVVLLDFWASWCGPCAAQAPILERIARKYKDLVVVLGINIGESPSVAARYAKAKGLSYPILADVEGDTQELYGASVLPTVVLIDKQGKVTAFVQGVVRQTSLERAIRNHR